MNNLSHISKHIINRDCSIKEALFKLNQLGKDAILFVTDESHRLLGTITDGDVRRGLIKGLSLDHAVTEFIQTNPIFIQKKNYDLKLIREYRKNNIKLLPIVNQDKVIVNIINLRLLKSYLPVDAVIFAGGEGRRLRPLTDNNPKPMLKVGDKPIIEHNIDRMASFGIDEFWITLRYLGEKISDYLGNGDQKQIRIKYLWEDEPLGTIGALSLIEDFEEDTILVINSDVLTDIDFEDFYLSFLESGADMSVASIPYSVDIPYAVLENENGFVIGLKEKPRYTYFSNAGIYLLRKSLVSSIPRKKFFNATDLMENIIQSGHKVFSYPIRSYWLDIGKHEDFQRAQEDIKHINLT